jgi:hypothetical protein
VQLEKGRKEKAYNHPIKIKILNLTDGFLHR